MSFVTPEHREDICFDSALIAHRILELQIQKVEMCSCAAQDFSSQKRIVDLRNEILATMKRGFCVSPAASHCYWDYRKLLPTTTEKALEFWSLWSEFIASTFKPTFNGKEQFASDVNRYGAGIVFGNHNEKSPEIDDIDWIDGKIRHDFAQIVTKLGIDSSLRESGLQLEGFARSKKPSDMYYFANACVGNHVLDHSLDIEAVARTMAEIVESKKLPVIMPEGGFYCMDVWKAGSLELAIKAGIKRVYLVTQWPIITLLDPKMQFDYGGCYEIPEGLQNNVRKANEFMEYMRSELARKIVGLPYPKAYQEAVRNHIRF